MAEVRGTVLVVDDEPSVCVALKRLFRLDGIDAQTFSSPVEFLKAKLPNPPTCLVLDVCLPGLDGLAVQQHLIQAGADLPIIFITGHGDIPMSVRAMKAGALDFLTKPFRGEELLHAIRRGFQVHAARERDRAAVSELQRRHFTLTARERQVFELVVEGCSNRQISETLGPAIKTVKIHRSRVMEKMGASSLANLVKIAEKLKAVSSTLPPSRT